MTQISNLQSNVPIHHDKILQQERLEEYYNNKKANTTIVLLPLFL